MPQNLSYSVYMGGLKVIESTLDLHTAPDEYRMAMRGETAGLVGVLATWHGTIETAGTYHNGAVLPIQHESLSVWPDSRHLKRFGWNPAGEIVNLYIQEDGTRQTPDLEPAVTSDRIDIMSAVYALMRHMERTGNCNHESWVFDGKRSFLARAIDRGTENLGASRYNIYAGPARKCEIEIEPQGGNWHDKLRGWMSVQEQSREAGTRPVVWLAPLRPGDIPVPVRLLARTQRGTFLMHLNDYSY